MNTNWEKTMECNLFRLLNEQNTRDPLYRSIVDLIKYPVITEKTYLALSQFKKKQYTFDVDLHLTKLQIKKLFEKFFNVNIIAINTHIPPRKKRRLGSSQGNIARFKRVIVTLKEGESLRF